MKNLMQLSSNNSRSGASVVDGRLILTFPNALTPVVWQMELSEAKASALEVKPGREPGSHALTLRTVRGETLEIAPFATRNEAVDGLMAVAKALENAHGHIRSGGDSAAPTRIAVAKSRNEDRTGRWAAGILGLLFVIVLFSLWGTLAPRPAGTPGTTNSAPSANGAQPQPGVPFSADDYLKGR